MEKFPSLSRLAKFYGLDTHDRFLTCTGDSEKLCRAQTTMVIVPHCLKKYEASLPDILSDQQAQAAAYNKNPDLIQIGVFYYQRNIHIYCTRILSIQAPLSTPLEPLCLR